MLSKTHVFKGSQRKFDQKNKVWSFHTFCCVSLHCIPVFHLTWWFFQPRGGVLLFFLLAKNTCVSSCFVLRKQIFANALCVYGPISFVKNKCRSKSHFATKFCGVCFQQLCVVAGVNFVVFVALPLQLCTTRAICRQTGKKVYISCAKISKCLLTFAQKNIKILLVKIWAKHTFATSNHRRMQ